MLINNYGYKKISIGIEVKISIDVWLFLEI